MLTELRDAIFATRKGQCLNRLQLEKLYTRTNAITRNTLNHVVSCPECLDLVNDLLGMPRLSERNVMDVLGRTTESTNNNVRSALKSFTFVSGWYLWFLASTYATDLLA